MFNATSTVPHFYEIRIENTNSCGYKCVMCPRDKQTRQIGFMSLEDFELLLSRFENFSGSVHLHGFGESLLDRKLPEKIALLGQKHPKARAKIISTLGVKVKDDYFDKLLSFGMKEMMISLYGFTQEAYKKVHGFDGFERVKKNLELLSLAKEKYPDTYIVIKVPGEGPAGALQLAKPDGMREFINWAEEKNFEVGYWPYVHNYGDGRNYNKPKDEKLCPVINGLRKNILHVTWDLKVIPCCFDFNASIPFGNLREQSLEEIFSSPEYLQFVLAHQSFELSDYPVCQNCEKLDVE